LATYFVADSMDLYSHQKIQLLSYAIVLISPCRAAVHSKITRVMFGDESRQGMMDILLLGGELLAERCRTDDLMPSPISCLPPCCMDPKVQGLDILIYCSLPGGS